MAEAERKRPPSRKASAPSVTPDKSSSETIGPSTENPDSSKKRAEGSSSPTIVSLKSERSRGMPLNFAVKRPRRSKRADGSTSPSIVSMKTDRSRGMPLNFAVKKRKREVTAGTSSHAVYEEDRKCVKKFRKFSGDSHLLKAEKDLKEAMAKKFASTSEGNGGQQTSLNSIYTELYITTGESEGPHDEHEFIQLQRKVKTQSPTKNSVNLTDIFKPLPGQERPHRIVLTKGSAGIGKSFSVQKFVLDWAEDKEYEDIDFVFCLAFREMNLSKDTQTFHKLLTDFHPALCRDLTFYTRTKALVILDGLDESRFQLDFENNKTVTSVDEVTSLGNLVVNLIQGNLLPNAKIWITSRKVAASQIPAKYVDMVTEIRGFNKSQKEEYFRRRFSDDLVLAERIISHIQSSVSLNIMCQIPIFCWISAVLFQEVFSGDEEAETPQTLTEMMAHYLFVQTKRRSRKYDKTREENEENLLKTHREFLLKLGKLAFVHLQKNNLIFYKEDLEDCGIDITEASVHSGFCTTVLREEEIFSQRKVFFFVHLTVQEFFAALYVYDCFTNKMTSQTTELGEFLNLTDKGHSLLDLLKMTVDKVLEKKNGHLVYFLRMLFGLMVEANRRVLQGLLTSPVDIQDTNKKVLTYLKSIRRKGVSPDNCISIFQTMVEMRDQKVKDEITEYLMRSDRSKTELSPMHCSALAYMLQVSTDNLDVLDLKSYNTSDEGRRRLIPAVKSSRRAILADCKVTTEWVEHLAFGLQFPDTPLRELDLSNNDLGNEGVKLLCDGLSNKCCKVKILSLSGCMIAETGCDSLAAALKSNPSHLTELDLSYNHLGESGANRLSELKEDHKYKLSKLNVEHGGEHRLTPGLKKYACDLTLDPNTAHKNLHLSDGNRKVTWVEEEQSFPDHPERFDQWPQVLCNQDITGRCYWEVDVLKPFNIGVTYRSIKRKEDVDDCKLGRNNKSWSLACSNQGCFVLHNNKHINVSFVSSRPSRVGVYVDKPAGILSFYRVSSDSRVCFHTFSETFNEPLYPAVELRTHSFASFR